MERRMQSEAEDSELENTNRAKHRAKRVKHQEIEPRVFQEVP